MNDTKPSIDEAPECDTADLDTAFRAMTDAEREEFLAVCEDAAEAAFFYRMENDAQEVGS